MKEMKKMLGKGKRKKKKIPEKKRERRQKQNIKEDLCYESWFSIQFDLFISEKSNISWHGMLKRTVELLLDVI